MNCRHRGVWIGNNIMRGTDTVPGKEEKKESEGRYSLLNRKDRQRRTKAKPAVQNN